MPPPGIRHLPAELPDPLPGFEEAKQRGGHTPHVLEKAFSWHRHFAEHGTMLMDK